jgi:hypothetical protein
VEWYGTPGGQYVLIHSDNMADLFLRVSEKAHVVNGNIFDAANDQTESVDDLLAKLILTSNRGTLMELGISPIATSVGGCKFD